MAKLLAIRRSRIARLQTSAAFRKYLKDRVKVEFDGVDQSDGLIAEAKDEATGLIDECATLENIITVHGYGLKIEADATTKRTRKGVDQLIHNVVAQGNVTMTSKSKATFRLPTVRRRTRTKSACSSSTPQATPCWQRYWR
jgi:phosphosulfolactate synthase (CoM biosynthesis protein A)